MKKLYIILYVLLLVIPINNAQTPTYYWNFEEGSGSTLIDIADSNNGTWEGSPQYINSFGSNNTGLYAGNFTENNDGIDTAISSNEFNNTNFTITVWVNATDTTPTEEKFIVARRNDVNTKNFQVNLDTTGDIQFQTYTACGSSDTSLFSNVSLSSGWHCLAFVLEESIAKRIYIDSVLVGESSSVASVPDNCPAQTTTIGMNDQLTVKKHWDGGLDEIGIYFDALNQSQVEEVCNFGFTQVYNDTVPSVVLNDPTDTETVFNTSVVLNCSATDDLLLTNISLYHNASGSFALNETSIVSTNSETILFNKTFNFDETILWNCQAYDNNSQSVFALNNFTFNLINLTPDILILTSPDNDSSVQTENTINFNYTIDQNSTCNFYINNSLIESQNVTPIENVFTETFIENQTIEWFVNCTSLESGLNSQSESRLLNIIILIPVILEDVLNLNECPTGDLQTTILFLFFIVFALALTVISLHYGFAMIGIFGGVLLLIMANFTAVCVGSIGLVMNLLGFLLIVYHGLIQKGTSV